jgi:glutathione S-transferase
VILYNSAISGNCYKVRLLAAHLGIPLELREVDVIDRTDPRDELAGLNPVRRAPTLVLHDGRPLAESNAIIWYLGEGSRLVPENRYDRAKSLQWMFFEQYEHEPAIAVARNLKSYAGPPELWEARREELTKGGLKALAALELGLEGRDWLAGDAMSVADIALYAYTHVADEGGFSLEPYPAIRAWVDRVAAEPGHVLMDA